MTFFLQASAKLADAVAHWEGGQSPDGLFHPYWDSYGRVWTIGFGHTEGVSQHSHPLSRAEAVALLHEDLNRKYAPAVRAIHRLEKQKQFDAIVSFVYNVGVGMLEPSHTIGQKLGAREFKQAADAILLYDYAGGQKLPGLTRRRQWERQLFLGGAYKVNN